MSCFSKPSIKIHPLDSSIVPKEELTCVICKKNKNVMTLTCKHNYCVKCFLKCKYCIKCDKLHNKRDWCWCCN